MTDFIEKLRLKQKAEEDSYFARRDRELIAALRARRRGLPTEIRSGGQTGVDRAALDAALALGEQGGWRVAGWCPRGRIAEDGPIDARYPLMEAQSASPAQRTAWNVRDADGTLILHEGPLAGGTALTRDVAERAGKPLLLLDLIEHTLARPPTARVRAWLQANAIRTLNIAGPRESGAPGIGTRAYALLHALLESLIADEDASHSPD